MFSSIFPIYQQILQQIVYYASFVLLLLALTIIILVCSRKILAAKDKIPIDLVDRGNKMILTFSTIILLCYLIEFLVAWISGYVYEQYAFFERAMGKYWLAYYSLLLILVIPQLYWKKKLRKNEILSLIVAFLLVINLRFESLYIFITNLIRQ